MRGTPSGGGSGENPAHGGPDAWADLGRARDLLEQADRIVVLTGAGVSAESGVPTFRGPEGVWREHRPEELATPGAFARDPRLVWEWYQWRRELVGRCRPNPAHRAIAALQRRRSGVTLVTQNVDGLHRLALRESDAAEGSSVLELHGSLFGVKCSRCAWAAERRDPVDAGSETSLPRCPRCGALVRPDVVWFGESLDPAVLDAAFSAAGRADLCLVVGTSAVVQPAASVPLATLERGGAVVEVNPDRTPLSGVARLRLEGPAGRLLPELLEPFDA